MSKCSVLSTENLKSEYSTLLRPKYCAERAGGVPRSRRAGAKAPSRRKRARIRDRLPRMRALHLGFHDIGVHDRPAVHGAHHSMYADCTISVDRDLRHFSYIALERLPHSDAACTAGG